MNGVQYRAAWIVAIGCLTSCGAWPQEALTLRQAISWALKQNPEATTAKAEVSEAQANLATAKTALLPQVSFTEDISRGDDPVYVFGTRLRQQQFTQADFALNALNRPDPLGNFSSRFSANWQIFDSLRTERQIRSAAQIKNSAASQAAAVDQQLIFGVIAAYQHVLYAEREVETARHELETAESLYSSASDRVKAGLTVESDRMAAEVNRAECKEVSIAAEGDLELAWAEFRQATGMPELGITPLAPIEVHSFPSGKLEEELASALNHRKDLAALSEADEAQGAATSAARLSYGPRVTAYGNWENDAASIAGASGSNWVAGMQMSIDLLPLGKRSQLAHEKAAKMRIDADVESYRQRIRVEVSRAHIQLQTAQLSLEAAHASTTQSAESLRIVRNRYDAGLATMTDLLRAGDAKRQSQVDYWRAVYGNTMAYVQLLLATGTLTPDQAEGLE